MDSQQIKTPSIEHLKSVLNVKASDNLSKFSYEDEIPDVTDENINTQNIVSENDHSKKEKKVAPINDFRVNVVDKMPEWLVKIENQLSTKSPTWYFMFPKFPFEKIANDIHEKLTMIGDDPMTAPIMGKKWIEFRNYMGLLMFRYTIELEKYFPQSLDPKMKKAFCNHLCAFYPSIHYKYVQMYKKYYGIVKHEDGIYKSTFNALTAADFLLPMFNKRLGTVCNIPLTKPKNKKETLTTNIELSEGTQEPQTDPHPESTLKNSKHDLEKSSSSRPKVEKPHKSSNPNSVGSKFKIGSISSSSSDEDTKTSTKSSKSSFVHKHRSNGFSSFIASFLA